MVGITKRRGVSSSPTSFFKDWIPQKRGAGNEKMRSNQTKPKYAEISISISLRTKIRPLVALFHEKPNLPSSSSPSLPPPFHTSQPKSTSIFISSISLPKSKPLLGLPFEPSQEIDRTEVVEEEVSSYSFVSTLFVPCEKGDARMYLGVFGVGEVDPENLRGAVPVGFAFLQVFHLSLIHFLFFFFFFFFSFSLSDKHFFVSLAKGSYFWTWSLDKKAF